MDQDLGLEDATDQDWETRDFHPGWREAGQELGWTLAPQDMLKAVDQDATDQDWETQDSLCCPGWWEVGQAPGLSSRNGSRLVPRMVVQVGGWWVKCLDSWFAMDQEMYLLVVFKVPPWF